MEDTKVALLYLQLPKVSISFKFSRFLLHIFATRVNTMIYLKRTGVYIIHHCTDQLHGMTIKVCCPRVCFPHICCTHGAEDGTACCKDHTVTRDHISVCDVNTEVCQLTVLVQFFHLLCLILLELRAAGKFHHVDC